MRTEGIPSQVEFPEGTEGVIRIPGCRILDEGFWNLTINDKARGYFALSNASLCAPAGSARDVYKRQLFPCAPDNADSQRDSTWPLHFQT